MTSISTVPATKLGAADGQALALEMMEIDAAIRVNLAARATMKRASLALGLRHRELLRRRIVIADLLGIRHEFAKTSMAGTNVDAPPMGGRFPFGSQYSAPLGDSDTPDPEPLT